MNQSEAELDDPPDPPTVSDSDLLLQIAKRDQGALAELYERYAGLLLALSHRVVGDRSDAEEVLQEVFLQVWNQAGRYDPARSSVSTWLVLITRSRSIDRLRSRQVKNRTLTALKEEKRDSHTSPEGASSVLLDQRRRRLRRVMRELPSEQRQVVELAFFSGMTQSEISGSTGVPLGTVKTRTLLAMKKLRRSLQPEIRELL